MTEVFLKPCPSCRSTHIMRGPVNFYYCEDCQLSGPLRDPAGIRWNALPRPEDTFAAARAALTALSLAGECSRKLALELIVSTELSDLTIAFARQCAESNPHPYPFVIALANATPLYPEDYDTLLRTAQAQLLIDVTQ